MCARTGAHTSTNGACDAAVRIARIAYCAIRGTKSWRCVVHAASIMKTLSCIERHACVGSQLWRRYWLFSPWADAAMPRARHGAPITAPATTTAASTHSSNARLRYLGSAEYALRTNVLGASGKVSVAACPGLSRPSTPWPGRKTWMRGSSPRMTRIQTKRDQSGAD